METAAVLRDMEARGLVRRVELLTREGHRVYSNVSDEAGGWRDVPQAGEALTSAWNKLWDRRRAREWVANYERLRTLAEKNHPDYMAQEGAQTWELLTEYNKHIEPVSRADGAPQEGSIAVLPEGLAGSCFSRKLSGPKTHGNAVPAIIEIKNIKRQGASLNAHIDAVKTLQRGVQEIYSCLNNFINAGYDPSHLANDYTNKYRIQVETLIKGLRTHYSFLKEESVLLPTSLEALFLMTLISL